MHNIDEPNWETLSKWPTSPKVVMQQYKFGFAVENTLCVGGYTTEKFGELHELLFGSLWGVHK